MITSRSTADKIRACRCPFCNTYSFLARVSAESNRIAMEPRVESESFFVKKYEKKREIETCEISVLDNWF